jgi:hypothetical protein
VLSGVKDYLEFCLQRCSRETRDQPVPGLQAPATSAPLHRPLWRLRGASVRIAVSKRSTTRPWRPSSGTDRRAGARARRAIARDRSAHVCAGSSGISASAASPRSRLNPNPSDRSRSSSDGCALTGVVESTLTSYGSYVGDLLRVLGDDAQTYTARGQRDFVEQRCRHYRRNSARMVARRRADVCAVSRGRGSVPTRARACADIPSTLVAPVPSTGAESGGGRTRNSPGVRRAREAFETAPCFSS